MQIEHQQPCMECGQPEKDQGILSKLDATALIIRKRKPKENQEKCDIVGLEGKE